MEFICSMTGKSPSTTGAGSEGALTKGPFNALPPIIDLNNALVSWILTGHNGFVTAAGYVGPKVRVDHDISLLVPEVWCRMSAEERDPQFLIAEHYLEKCEDFEHAGKRVLASRLGYRINARFVHAFFGRVFNHPHAVFTEEMLRPELQDLDIFADGMDNIVTTQKRVAKMYFDDGSVAQACPPLQGAAAHHAARSVRGQGLDHPEVRGCSRANTCSPAIGTRRGFGRGRASTASSGANTSPISTASSSAPSHADEAERLGIAARLARARKSLEAVDAPDFLQVLAGTLGTEPIEPYLAAPPPAPQPCPST